MPLLREEVDALFINHSHRVIVLYHIIEILNIDLAAASNRATSRDRRHVLLPWAGLGSRQFSAVLVILLASFVLLVALASANIAMRSLKMATDTSLRKESARWTS